jgi:hypothetical protein
MAKLYLYKPGYNPYKFQNASVYRYNKEYVPCDNQLIEFTNEYMMAKVTKAGHWHSTGNASIENSILIPCVELLKKCDGKIYIEFESSGNVSGRSSSNLYINDIDMTNYVNKPKAVYSYNMPNKDTKISFGSLHNSGSGAYVKVYSIYIEVAVAPSEKIKSSVKDAILNHELIREHVTIQDKGE